MTSGLAEKINRKRSVEISQCFPLPDAKYWLISGFLKSIKQSSRLTPLGDECSEPDLALWELLRKHGQGVFLGICSCKSYSERENLRFTKKKKPKTKPHCWNRFPEALSCGGGRGRDCCLSKYQHKDYARNENYRDEARQSERLRSISMHKIAEKKKKKRNKVLLKTP